MKLERLSAVANAIQHSQALLGFGDLDIETVKTRAREWVRPLDLAEVPTERLIECVDYAFANLVTDRFSVGHLVQAWKAILGANNERTTNSFKDWEETEQRPTKEEWLEGCRLMRESLKRTAEAESEATCEGDTVN